jgi:Ni,Fe-hydrogenase III small subunit
MLPGQISRTDTIYLNQNGVITSDTSSQNSAILNQQASASVVIKCSACSGSGKMYQQEIKRKKVITKDISNGIGPKNYVTYTIDEVLRPAGYLICTACKGTGKK